MNTHRQGSQREDNCEAASADLSGSSREATLRQIHLHVARQASNAQPPPPLLLLSCLPGVTQVLLCL